MTSYHRFPILAIAAILIAGCGANTATSAPTASLAAGEPSAGPTSPAASQSNTFPAPPTRRPNAACEALDEESWRPSADFDVWTPLGGSYLGLDVTRMSSISNPDEIVQFDAGDPYLDDPIRIVGGWQISLVPEIDYDQVDEVQIALVAASAVLQVAGRDPIRMHGIVGMDPETDKAGFLFNVPDVRGSAVIDFAVEWSDACRTFRAERAWGFEMVRAAYAARCPTDHEGFAAHWAGLEEPPLSAGGVPVALFRSSTFGTWTPYAVSAQGNVGFAHWDPEAAFAVGSAGGMVRVGDGNPDLKLELLSTEFFRRRDVIEWIDGGDWPGRDLIVFRSTSDPYPDGHFELLLPADPGGYVASFYFQWETPCASGDGVGAVGVQVE